MLSIDGKVDVRCSRERAWALFNRFGEVAALIPTVEEVEVRGDKVFARMATTLGVLPVSSRLTLEVIERKPFACLKAVGISYLGETIREQINPSAQGVAADSVGQLKLHLDLRPGGEAGVLTIWYWAEVEAQGRLKRIYQSILKSKAPALMEQFARNVKGALEGAAPAPAAAASGWARLIVWLRGVLARATQRAA